jgi:hypothetical protein
MEPHGFRHFRAEPGFQPDLAQFFMLIIHAMLGGVITQIMHQMADIMQQCRSDQCAEWRQLPGPGNGAPWWSREVQCLQRYEGYKLFKSDIGDQWVTGEFYKLGEGY